MAASVELRIAVGERAGDVSALLLQPDGARLLYVLAHGAGAGMRHPFLEAVARQLGERGIGTLRYQFPYMERRAGRPHPPPGAAAAGRAPAAQATPPPPRLPPRGRGKAVRGRLTATAPGQAAPPPRRGRGLPRLPPPP